MPWEEMIKIEPRLLELYLKAKEIKGKRRRINLDRIWFGINGLKAEMMKLVGWHADKKELNTPIAYETAYRVIYGVLER